MSVAVEVERLSCFYGAHTVLRDVSFSVETGRWLGLIGPNGAGKSSLLRALVGLGESEGAVAYNGATLVGRNRSRAIAYLPQNPILPSGMTVAEYVLLGRTAHLGWFEREGEKDRQVSVDALTRLDLTHFGGRFVTDLSGGEAQRVTLARVLAQEAPVILLDEPTSALDIGHQQHVLSLVDELRKERGLTVIAAMHDLTSAGRFSDELLFLHKGTIAAHGPRGEVLTKAMLSTVYETDVTVIDAPDGSRVVLALG
jgi:iron complex transport system ATP-binding protein